MYYWSTDGFLNCLSDNHWPLPLPCQMGAKSLSWYTRVIQRTKSHYQYCAITQAVCYNLCPVSLSDLGTPCAVTQIAIPILTWSGIPVVLSKLHQPSLYMYLMLVPDLPPLFLSHLCAIMLFILCSVLFLGLHPVSLPNPHLPCCYPIRPSCVVTQFEHTILATSTPLQGLHPYVVMSSAIFLLVNSLSAFVTWCGVSAWHPKFMKCPLTR